MPQLCWMANADGWLFWYNRRWYEYTGTTPEQMEGWGWQSVHDPGALPGVMDKWQASIATGNPFEMVFPLRGADGVFRPFLTRGVPILDGEGKVVRWFGTNTDITEQKRAESVIQARLRLSVAASDISLDEMLQKTMDEIETLTQSTIGFYHFLEADQETLSLQAWSTNTLSDMCTAEGKGNHYPVSNAGVWVDCLRERRPVIHNDYASLPHRKGMPPGHAPVIREMVIPIIRGDRIVAIIGIGNKPADYNETDVEIASLLGDFSWEIVERKRAEQALKESEAQFRTFADAIPTLCWMANGDGWIFWYNSRWYEYTGTTPDQMEGWGWQSVHDPEALPGVMDKWQASIATGNPFDMVFPLRGADDVFRPFLTRVIPVRDEDGNIIRWFGTNTDITEQKRSEKELEGLVSARTAELDSKNLEIRRQSEQLSVTLKSIGDAVIATDKEGRVTFLNPVAELATGWQSAEAEGQPLEKVFHIINEQTRKPVQNPVVRVLQEGHVVGLANHTALIRKDGSEIPIEDSAAPIRDGGGNIIGVVLVFHDVTEKHLADEALRDSEERFRLMVSGVQDYAILMLSPAGEVVSWNEGAERIKGYTGPEIIGRNFSCFYPREDVIDGKPARQLEYAASKGSYEEEEGLRVRKDGSAFWANAVITAMYDEDGRLRGFSKVIRDISERKLLEDEALRTQKLESLRVLAGGIAHDLNNMMVAVEGNAGLAIRALGNDSLVKEYLTGIEDAAEKVAGFSKQILSFTGKKDENKEPVRLNDVVKETGRLLIASVSKKAELGYTLSDGLPVIMANPQNMQQVVMNLIINASDALGEGKGAISVSTGVLNADRQYLDTLHPVGLPEGGYVYVEVSDTGCGMSQDTRKRIFDPFFTTKFMGRGLGLSAVFGIAIGHGGGVGLETEEACGATFRVLLPVPATPVEAAANKAWTEDIRVGKGTILVVDDEEDSRMMAKKVLETVGYTVLTAADGAEGIEIFKKNRDSVSAVIMDLIMPHVRGDEAAKEIRNIRDDINILLLSGYHEIDMKDLMEGLGRTVVLEKPYKINKLLEKVQGMLKV